MKAVILTAGVGSRIRPLTDETPKPLIAVGNSTIMGMMMDGIVSVGITEVVIVTGYRSEQIQKFLKTQYPQITFHFINNDNYEITNTGYSLLMTKDAVDGDDFIKFDGDVVFDKAILERLITSEHATALCIDTNINLEAEEVKVITDNGQKVLEVGKKLDPSRSTGESIGIEKISKDAAKVLYAELEKLLADKANWQEYYDDTYTTLVEKDVPFHAVDITDKKWVEIDTHEDYALANKMFGE